MTESEQKQLYVDMITTLYKNLEEEIKGNLLLDFYPVIEQIFNSIPADKKEYVVKEYLKIL